MPKKIIAVIILLIAFMIGVYFTTLTEVKVTIFSELEIYLGTEVEIIDGRTGYSFKLDDGHEIALVNRMINELHLVEVGKGPMEPGGSFSIRYYNDKGEIYATFSFDGTSSDIYINDVKYNTLYGGWSKLYALIADLSYLEIWSSSQDEG